MKFLHFLLISLICASWSFVILPSPKTRHSSNIDAALYMGLFDGISKAFSNADFKSQDQRVRASHILIKGEDIDVVLGTTKKLFEEINERSQQQAGTENLGPIFAELAKRESQCASAAQGGDLGLFGPGKMVKEFDEALFPQSGPIPPAGSLVGPVITDFGTHIILVTKREDNQDQVEEKLARIDPDAQL
mmetsp:Transcript_7658/g.18452  ORF Transcript_7658/g.18452 Transcript_7658/m.18452 type:complete len:190 (+) Transcript_7658:103-672(+)